MAKKRIKRRASKQTQYVGKRKRTKGSWIFGTKYIINELLGL